MKKVWMVCCCSLLTVVLCVPSPSKSSPKTIPWSAARKLNWDDFKMRLPETRGNDAHAEVNITWQVNPYCPDNRLWFTVTAVFLTEKSWVDKNQESENLLQHEQLHFDLAELYARALRQRLSSFKVDCSPTAAPPEFDQIGNKYVDALNAAHKRYDLETQHGLNGTRQGEWEQKVKAFLLTINPSQPSRGFQE